VSNSSLAQTSRHRRPRAFWLLGLVVLYLAAEVLGFLAFWLAAGTPFTPSRADRMREAVLADEDPALALADGAAASAQAALKSALSAHPFLGYVLDPNDPNSRIPVSAFGFPGTRSPIHRHDASKYVIAVVGGSLAFQTLLYAESTLRERLAECETLRGKSIEIVPLAIGAYKQPQSLLAIQLLSALGGHFDCVIALDGYNEIALVDDNLAVGAPEWYPNYWPTLLDSTPTASRLAALARLYDRQETRHSAARWFDSLRLSPLAQFFWFTRDRRLAAAIASSRAKLASSPSGTSHAQTGPGPTSKDPTEARERMIALWRECSQMLDAFCESRGARYFHFLQPNQYVADAKPIGPVEARVALIDTPLTRSVRDFYPRLIESGRELRERGVAFTDLTRIFVEHPESLYVDNCCHLGNRGSQLLAATIAATIRADLDLADVQLDGLEVSPQELRFDSPFERVALTLTARGSDGRARRLDPRTAGLMLEAIPRTALDVEPDGRVRAMRRGTSRLRVEFRGRRHEIEVTAQWPDLVVGDDDFVAESLGGRPPTLLVDPATIRSAAGLLRLRGTDLPIGAMRLLVTGTTPPPPTLLGIEHSDFISLPFGAGSPNHETEVPIPPADGSILFFRIYGVGDDASKVLARSRCVAVTRE
jgi:hypothetical protein